MEYFPEHIYKENVSILEKIFYNIFRGTICLISNYIF